ncbi:MAG: sugar phosphate isomerase/epimerase family protein [Spirochaetia bacterium]|jgi:sugar phosphate isomerase/epimerase
MENFSTQHKSNIMGQKNRFVEDGKLKLSCLPVSLFSDIINRRLTIAEWAELGRKIGLDGVDISLLFLENHCPAYLGKLSKALEKTGVPLIMATAYPDFTNPDPVQRKRELDYLRRDIALSSQLRIRYLRVLAGQAHPATSRSAGIKWAVENLSFADETAREYGMQLLYENHSKPGAWDYYDFSYPLDIFLQILEGIRDTGIRINFDTANIAALGQDPLTVLAQVYDRVETVHVSDTAEKGTFQPVLVGTGVVAFEQIFRYLKSRRFDNWLCIEEASFSGAEGIRKAADFTRRTWEAA